MRYKRYFGIFIRAFILFLIVPLQSNATDHGVPQITKIPNESEREEYAKELELFFKKIRNSIPTLSPTQQSWLNMEFESYKKTNNAVRLYEAMSTKEYKIYHVGNVIDSILVNLDNILFFKDSKQFFFWSKITDELLSLNFWNDVNSLVRLGIIDKKLFFQRHDGELDSTLLFLMNGVTPAKQIIGNIIEQHLSGGILR